MRSGFRFTCRSGSAATRRGAFIACLALAAVVAARSSAAALCIDTRTDPRIVERIRRLGPVVRGVEFVGNETYGADELLDYMATRPSGVFHRVHYTPRKLDRDVGNLQRLYASRGFLEATVDVEDVLTSPNGLSVSVLLGVREGRRWSVTDVTIEGARALDADSLATLLSVREGSPLLADSLDVDRGRLLSEYARRSYLDARVSQSIERDDEAATAKVLYSIKEGPRARIASIGIRGTVKTRDYVLEREFRFSKGELFDPDAIGATQAALYRTGLFNTVVIESAPEDTGKAEKQLLVRVRERASGAIDFTAGYAMLDGYEARAELGNRNIQGQATTAGLEGRFAEFAREARASVGDPWFLGLPVAASATVRYGWENAATFTAETAGGDVTFSKLFGRALTVRAGYSFERVLVLETSDPEGELGANYSGTLTAGSAYDTRDDVLDATRGVLLTAQVDVASSRLGGTNDFVRTGVSARAFRKIGRSLVLASAVEAGRIDPGRAPGDVPVNERYFVGGEATVRGFARNSIAPAAEGGEAGGGLALLVGRLEARVAVWKGLSVVGFADAGRAFRTFDAVRLPGLAVGAGGGLRYATRIGVLRLDMATPVSEKGRPKAYFSIGQAF